VFGCSRTEPYALAIEPVRAVRKYRLSFFNNQEEVVKRFVRKHLEMGASR
jgi:hypothetical protein